MNATYQIKSIAIESGRGRRLTVSVLIAFIFFFQPGAPVNAMAQNSAWEATIIECRDARERGDTQAAMDASKRAIKLAGDDTAQQAISWNEAGLVALEIKKPGKAIEHFDRAIAMWKSDSLDRSGDLVASMENRGVALFFDDQHQEAADQFQKVLELISTTLGENDPSMIRLLQRISECDAQLGRSENSAAAWSRITSIQESIHGPVSIPVARAKDVTASHLRDSGSLDQSITLLRESLQIRESILGEYDLEVINSLYRLGETQALAGNDDTSISILREALARAKETLGPDTPDVLPTVRALLEVCERAGRDELVAELKPVRERLERMFGWYQDLSKASAESDVLDRLEKQARRFGEDSRPVAAIKYRRAKHFAESGDYDSAIDQCRQAIDHEKRLLGEKHVEVGSGYYILAGYNKQQNNIPAAIESLRQARAANAGARVPNRIQQQNYAYELARLLSSVNEFAETFSLLDETYQSRRELGLEVGEMDADVLNRMGVCKMHLSSPAEATAYFEQSIKLFSVTRTADDPMLQTVRANLDAAQSASNPPVSISLEDPIDANTSATDNSTEQSADGNRDLVLSIIFCLCGAYYAHGRGYSPAVWLLLTAGVGIIIALSILVILPNRRTEKRRIEELARLDALIASRANQKQSQSTEPPIPDQSIGDMTTQP